MVPLHAAGRTALNFGPTIPLDFGDQIAGTTSPLLFFSISNNSATAITISSITASSEFSITPDPATFTPLVLPAFYGTGMQVAFTPAALGPRTGSVTVTASDSPTLHVIPLIGRGVSAGQANLSSQGLDFGYQPVGSNTMRSVTLSNTGSGPFAILGMTTAAPYAQTNNCPASLNPAAACQVDVVFSPTVQGTVVGSLAIDTDAAGSPHLVSLSGTASGPILYVSSSSLTFTEQFVGGTSATQSLTVRNDGDGAMQFAIGGIAADFQQTNTCPGSFARAATCTIQVSFKPVAVGWRSGSLTIVHNAAGSPTSISLSGPGVDFQMAAASGSSSSATVIAGQSAIYRVDVMPMSFSGPVNLSCSGAPRAATCTVSPATLTLSGGMPGTVTVTVTTTARSSGSIPGAFRLPFQPLPIVGMWLLLLAAALAFTVKRSLRRLLPATAVALLLLLLWGCGGGGGGSSPPPQPTGTPAGNYTLTLTAAGGNGSHSMSLSLRVD
jgi:hypothetical protein